MAAQPESVQEALEAAARAAAAGGGTWRTPPLPAVREPAAFGSDPPGQLAEAILRDALGRGAEAIHIETERDGLALRLHVDGIVHEKPNFKSHLPGDLGKRLIERFESVAALPARAPRKAVFRARLDGKIVWLRVALCPTPYGHRLVVRPIAAPMEIAALGLSADAVQAFREVLAVPSGLVLVAGPPKSGRTTTLRALVAEIGPGRPTLAIDPGREFVADGIRRLHIGSEAGLPVPWGIKACLEQPPGVLVVDEIRDAPAVVAAIEAALAGHLVLAAVPSDDLWPDATMLLAPGVDPLALAAALVAISVQRLVRKVCPECKGPADASALAALGIQPGRAARLCHPSPPRGEGGVRGPGKGCPKCRRAGYAGRTGLFCGLRVNEAVMPVMRQDLPGDNICWAARPLGPKSLEEAGRAMVLEGTTTPEEVLRVMERR